MAHHVDVGEVDPGDAFDAAQYGDGVAQPRAGAGGRSTWLGSPVTAMREFSPRRVRNIFICIGVVFCASSRMTKALASVRPRMNPIGAASISPLASRFATWSAGSMSCSAS